MRNKTLLLCIMAVFAMYFVFMAGEALAFTTPVVGDTLYDAYDLVFNDLLDGPVGYLGAGFLFLTGLATLVQGRGFITPTLCLVGSGVLPNVDGVVETFGFML